MPESRHDWPAVVRGLLDDADLPAAYETEIIDELAAHLEDRYRAALEAGRSEQEALALARAEVPDGGAFAGSLPRMRRMAADDGGIAGKRGRGASLAGTLKSTCSPVTRFAGRSRGPRGSRVVPAAS
jgi:hypothetical protein